MMLTQRRRADAAGEARVRGAALAVATAAMGVQEHVRGPDVCDEDPDCLAAVYVDLVQHRARIRYLSDELRRLEGDVWHVPTVRAARAIVDRTHDAVVAAYGAARTAVMRLDPRATPAP